MEDCLKQAAVNAAKNRAITVYSAGCKLSELKEPLVYEPPSHEEIDLAKVEPQDLGLDCFDEKDDKLMDAIFAAKQKKVEPQTMLDYALDAVRRGFFVFPCKPGLKEPAGEVVPNGLLDATQDVEKIKGWWTVNPNYNPAVNLEMSGKVVRDYDLIAPLLPEDGRAFVVKSGRINPPGRDGGYHCYYEGLTKTRPIFIEPVLPIREVEEVDKRGKVHTVWYDAQDRKVVKGWVAVGEIRSRGAYVVWDGALHKSGNHYQITNDVPFLPWNEPDDVKDEPSNIIPVGTEEQEQVASYTEAAFNAANVDYKPRTAYQGGFRWLIDCPFDYNHESPTKLIQDGGSSAAVIMLPNGALSFKCQHAHCMEQKWADLRADMEKTAGRPLQFGESGQTLTLNIRATEEQRQQFIRESGSNFINIVPAEQRTALREAQSKTAETALDAWMNAPAENPIEMTTEQVVAHVQMLSKMGYEQRRKKIADKTALRTSYFDSEYEKATNQTSESDEVSGVAALISDIRPWGEPVNLVEVLEETESVFRQYIHFKRPEDSTTAALWVGQTYTAEHQSEFPYLGARSPVEGCGKTRVLDLLVGMSYRTLKAGNLTAASAFRVMDSLHPCLIIDEVDTFIHIQPEFVGILNMGHTKEGGYVLRVLGENHDQLTPFAVWGPKAYGMIGTAPATFASRSIPIILERAAKGDGLTQFPKTPNGKEALKLRLRTIASKWKRWADDNSQAIANWEPDMSEFENRAADNWYPLMRIAEMAGWAEKALKAAHVVDPYAKQDTARLMLRDIQNIFHTRKEPTITPGTLVSDLLAQATGWDEMGRLDKPLTGKKLADMLADFGIRSHSGSQRLYHLDDFREVFSRYLTDPPQDTELGGMKEVVAPTNTTSLERGRPVLVESVRAGRAG
jgi:Protein of unknown function (DUF3631)/Bifunctional DNA primase/polymerase, N-terminal